VSKAVQKQFDDRGKNLCDLAMNVITTVNSHPISIDPVFFEIGPLQLRWYGLMYSISFLILIFVLRRERRQGFLPLPEVAVERLFLGLIGGVLIGARVFYVIFYAPELILDGPLEWIAIWHGGLSFHGGLSGVLAVSYYFAKRHKISWFSILDTLALVAPLALGLAVSVISSMGSCGGGRLTFLGLWYSKPVAPNRATLVSCTKVP
jgi:prolipoprotein diacylglyceryl transferase